MGGSTRFLTERSFINANMHLISMSSFSRLAAVSVRPCGAI
jgi:hypothetical protein